MRSFFKRAIDALAAAQDRRVRSRLISSLDERTLRDIGLEHEANRARDRTRYAFTRFGVY